MLKEIPGVDTFKRNNLALFGEYATDVQDAGRYGNNEALLAREENTSKDNVE